MSSFDFNYLLRSPSGKIKLASAVVGLLAMAFCAGGHAHHKDWGVPVQQKLCEISEDVYVQEAKQNNLEYPGYFGRCPRFGFAEAGLAFVIIAWLFSVVIVIISAMPSMIEQPLFRKIDAFGHIGAGVVDILGFLLVIAYVYNISALLDCSQERMTDEGKSRCIKRFVWEAEGVEYINGVKIVRSSGYRMIIWIFGALLALAHGIVCIVIFVLVKKAQGQTGPMMMVNQTASQAPPGSYPSQAGSQQQAPPPEQQPSGHHSKHSHKV